MSAYRLHLFPSRAKDFARDISTDSYQITKRPNPIAYYVGGLTIDDKLRVRAAFVVSAPMFGAFNI